MTKKDLNYIFPFGKYKGRKMRDIFDSEGVDTSYLTWCIQNVSSFSNAVSKDFKECIEKNHNKPTSTFIPGDMMSGESAYFNGIHEDTSIN